MAKHTPAHEARPVKPVMVRNPRKGRTRLGRTARGRGKIGRAAAGFSR